MVDEMKATPTCVLDRVAYTATVDACIAAGSPERESFALTLILLSNLDKILYSHKFVNKNPFKEGSYTYHCCAFSSSFVSNN
jgi:hypothetical protein